MILKKTIITGLLILSLGFTALGQNAQSGAPWSLEECINYAFANNLTIRNNELDKLNNEIALKESKFAMLPNLSAGGQLGKSFGRTIDPVTNEFISTDFLSGGVSANSSVTLSSGGRIRNRIKQNELNLRVSDFDLESAKNDIGLTVATNFLNVLLNREQLENNKFQLQTSQEQLDRTKKLVEAGSLPISNQLDLESQVASNEVNVVNAENALNLALLALKQSMQMPADENLTIEAPSIEVSDVLMISQSPGEIYNIALNNQPQIKSADLGIESSDVGIKIAKGAFYPSLFLNGSLSTNYSDRARQFLGTQAVTVPSQQIGTVETSGGRVFSLPSTREISVFSEDYSLGDQFNDNLGQSISLSLNIPIFSRMSNSAGLQRAQINRQRAEITALNTRNQLRQNIETAYTNALASFKSYEATQKRVAALQESFRATEQQYSVGAANFVDYQVASNNLFAARADLVRTKYEYIFRTKILDFYLGNPITLK